MSAATPSRLRVTSWNIHKGFNLGNTRFLLDEMRQAIRLVDSDVVFLQEVVGENQRRQRRLQHWVPEQFEYLADEVWPHFAYGRNAIYGYGHHGNAMLSKYPFKVWSQRDLSVLPGSQRGLLYGQIAPGIHLICVHLGLLQRERQWQVRQLIRFIHEHLADEPLILAGDFNDWRERSDRELCHGLNLREAYRDCHGRLARTYPARRPWLRTDRIYYRHLELLSAQRLTGEPWRNLSDHCALYAEFQLPNGSRKAGML